MVDYWRSLKRKTGLSGRDLVKTLTGKMLSEAWEHAAVDDIFYDRERYEEKLNEIYGVIATRYSILCDFIGEVLSREIGVPEGKFWVYMSADWLYRDEAWISVNYKIGDAQVILLTHEFRNFELVKGEDVEEVAENFNRFIEQIINSTKSKLRIFVEKTRGEIGKLEEILSSQEK